MPGALPDTILPSALGAGESADDFRKRVQDAAAAELAKDGAHEVLLRTVAQLLEVFVCENFTGSLTEADKAELSAVVALGEASQEKALHATCLNALIVDGEVMNSNVRYPLLLLLLNSLVEATIEEETPAVHLWRARTYLVHQRCLANRSHNLLQRSVQSYTALLALDTLEDCSDVLLDPTAEGGAMKLPSRAELHLAKGLLHFHYHEPHLSHDDLQKACTLSGMKTKVTSMMGVRTEHQVFETAQLMVRAASAYENPARYSPAFTPVMVEGSNVLHRPRRLEENIQAGTVKQENCEAADTDHKEDAEVVDTPLTPLEQAVVLGLCVNVRNNNPMHGLTEEERLPYLERLIVEEGMPWALRSCVYLLRSRMEQKRVRVRERGLMQFCELCDQFFTRVTNPDTKEALEKSTRHRYAQFWTVLSPPIFKLKEELGDTYMDVGMLKSALDIHESICNWPRVIKCCKRLDKKTKAESLIRNMLETDPNSAILWSHLGDATRKAEYYEKSWEMANGRLAAPMRGLGELYLEKERFADAVECFDKALQLNPVYGANWFSMGWAAMKTGQWERASHCYTRNVQLDNEDGQSWSNLATCYLQMGDEKLVQAYHCLVQAKKWSTQSWRIWDNLFTVAVELGERSTAIQVLSELLELKGRDYKVNGKLVKLLVEGVCAVLRGEEEVNRRDYKVRRHTDPNAEPQPQQPENEDDEDTLDDEIFNVVPFGADMDLEDTEPTEAQVARQEAEAEAADKARASAVTSLRQKTHQVLGKATSLHTGDADLYCALANLLEACDSMLEAFDMRFKDLRCLMKRNWQSDRVTAMDVIASATRLVKGAGRVDDEALAERKVKTTPPKTQASMQVQPVLKLAEDTYGKTPEYQALAVAMENLQ